MKSLHPKIEYELRFGPDLGKVDLKFTHKIYESINSDIWSPVYMIVKIQVINRLEDYIYDEIGT